MGLGSPPSSVLCSAKTADCPSRSPSLLARPPIPWPAPFGSCSVAGSPVGTAQNPPDAWAFVQPVAHPLRHLWRETVGSPKFPSCPCEYMPRSQTPVVPQGHRHNAPKTAAFRNRYTVGFPPLPSQSGIPMTTTTLFRGSITRPAPWLRPASHTPLLEMHADFTTDLLAGLWSGGTLFISEPHPLGNNSEFPPALRESQRLGLRLARID